MTGSGISIVANSKPIVTDIGMALQTRERKIIRDEYIMKRMCIPPPLLADVDSYTLGRVPMKTPKRHIYIYIYI